MPDVAFWQGNEAIAYGSLAAGCRFFGGYPITPSSEIAEIMAEELPKLNGRFIQMEDEIAGIAATIGGSIAGMKSLTATSGPGFSLKQENLGLAYMAEIPIVVVDVMRGGPSTGLPTKTAQQDVMQARWGTHGDHGIIALSPGSVREAFDVAVASVNFSEKYRTPVINVLMVGGLALSAVSFDLDTALALVNFGALVAFSFVNLSVIGQFWVREKRNKTLKDHLIYLLMPLLGAATIGALWINLEQSSLELGLIWAGLGVTYLFLRLAVFRIPFRQYEEAADA